MLVIFCEASCQKSIAYIDFVLASCVGYCKAGHLSERLPFSNEWLYFMLFAFSSFFIILLFLNVMIIHYIYTHHPHELVPK